jgi:hypothetical protein
LLGISLIATIVYLRWKELQGTEISERSQIEKSVCHCFSTSENVLTLPLADQVFE